MCSPEGKKILIVMNIAKLFQGITAIGKPLVMEGSNTVLPFHTGHSYRETSGYGG
jgi:hypothetical protein